MLRSYNIFSGEFFDLFDLLLRKTLEIVVIWIFMIYTVDSKAGINNVNFVSNKILYGCIIVHSLRCLAETESNLIAFY